MPVFISYALLCEIKGAWDLSSRWDYLTLKSSFFVQSSSNFRFWVQMDAYVDSCNFVKIDSKEDVVHGFMWFLPNPLGRPANATTFPLLLYILGFK